MLASIGLLLYLLIDWNERRLLRSWANDPSRPWHVQTRMVNEVIEWQRIEYERRRLATPPGDG